VAARLAGTGTGMRSAVSGSRSRIGASATEQGPDGAE